MERMLEANKKALLLGKLESKGDFRTLSGCCIGEVLSLQCWYGSFRAGRGILCI